MIRVQDIKLSLDEDKSQLLYKIAKKLRIKPQDITYSTIYKEAIDARQKPDIKLVYTIDIETPKEAQLLKKYPQLKIADLPYEVQKKGEGLIKRPVIVGSGPCGLFAALILAEQGFKPIVVERGKCVEERIKDITCFWEKGIFNPKSNVQFGEGGAGTFSDGKLTTQIKNKRCRKVLEEMVEAGADAEILYKNKPHIGTDILRKVIINIRQKIIALGGTFYFETQLTDIEVENGAVKAVILNDKKRIETNHCILAIGHSARDTFEMLYNKALAMEQKAFSIGMRVEHLQEWINEAQYGKENANHPKLGAADYKLSHHCKNGRSVYSFCMCPGGYVIASASEEGHVVTNGMSEHARNSPNANSAILVNITPSDFNSDHPLAGIALQRYFEEQAFKLGGNHYNAPIQRLEDFRQNKTTTALGIVKPTYRPNVTFSNLKETLPPFMSEAIEEAMQDFGKKIENFDHPDALFTGFETRSSSPVRLKRNAQYESNIKGLYPAGEGAGYAGGITSAAVDGIQIAEALVSQYGGVVE